MKKNSPYIVYILLLSLTFVLTGCQTPVDKTMGWTSESGKVRPGPKTGKVVLALLKKSSQASKKGDLRTAESHLERALRIEPQNPSLWLYMAKLRLYAAKSAEAINLAKKALALSPRAGDNSRFLQADCWQVIAHAHQKMGEGEQALKAQDKAKELRY